MESPPIELIPFPIRFPAIPTPAPAKDSPTFYPRPSVKVVPFNKLVDNVLVAEETP